MSEMFSQEVSRQFWRGNTGVTLDILCMNVVWEGRKI